MSSLESADTPFRPNSEGNLMSADSPHSPSPTQNWDRRRRNSARYEAIRTLECAVRHLILEHLAAKPAVTRAIEILWDAIDRIHAEESTHQRTQRLAAAWLPSRTLNRMRRDEAAAA